MCLVNSTLVGPITFATSGVTVVTMSKEYNVVSRQTSMSSVRGANSASPMSFSYSYDSAKQITSVTNADGSYWVYVYL